MSNKETSWKVNKITGDEESPTATRRQMIKNLKAMPQGKVVLGAIGRDLDEEEPIKPKEVLTEEEKKGKKQLQQLLLKYISPPEMGSKFKPDQERLVLRRKVEKQTLGELRRFWEGKIPADGELDEDAIGEINRKWRDISP